MERADKLALLRRTGLLVTLSEAELERFLGACREVTLAPGQALCHEGEDGGAMYVVLAGNLVVSKAGKQVAVGRPGDCFGEMALIERRERAATLRALDDTLVLEIPDAAFREHLSANPAALMALLRVFSERSRHDLDSLVSANLKLLAQAEEMDRKNRELNETRRQLEHRNRDLERISALDTLTQIANRRRFDAVLRQEWRRSARDESPLSLVFCDIDYFKRFNDTYGHQAGDECLVRVAQAMEETLNRPADLVARYGGEEFIALLVDTGIEGARMLAERMRARVEGLNVEHRASGVASHLTVSLGVASVVPTPASRPEDLVDLADRALYAAKEGGATGWSPPTISRSRRPRRSPPLVAAQLQRKRRRPSAKLAPPQAARSRSRGHCETRSAPSRVTARSASLSAVRGSARSAGCTACGKRSTEKKTPEATNIGRVTRFMRPLTVSIFRARQPTARPRPAKHIEPRRATAITAASEPRTGTPRASAAKPRKNADFDEGGHGAHRHLGGHEVGRAHGRREQALQQLLDPHVHEGVAHAPHPRAHEVHADEAGHEEVHVAPPRLADRDVAALHGVRAARRALEGVVDPRPRDAGLGPRGIEPVLDGGGGIGRGRDHHVHPPHAEGVLGRFRPGLLDHDQRRSLQGGEEPSRPRPPQDRRPGGLRRTVAERHRERGREQDREDERPEEDLRLAVGLAEPREAQGEEGARAGAVTHRAGASR